MAYDFRPWLETKPSDEEYDYMNCRGDCPVGQYMREVHNEAWSIERYNAHIHTIFGALSRGHEALQKSKTFGELRTKLRELA